MSNMNANATQATEAWYNWSARALVQDLVPTWNMCLYSGLVQPPFLPVTNQVVALGYKPLVQQATVGENLNLMLNQDALFGAAGQVITYTPANPPIGYIAGTHLRTHINVQSPGLLDTFYGIPGEPLSLQPPPNPIIAISNRELLSWLRGTPLQLLNLDALFGAAGEVLSYTWIVPLGYVFPIALRTFLSELRQNLIGQDTILGVAGEPLPHIEFVSPRAISFPFENRGILISEETPLVLIVPPVVAPPVVVPAPPAVVVVPAKGINAVELGYALMRRFLELFRDQ